MSVILTIPASGERPLRFTCSPTEGNTPYQGFHAMLATAAWDYGGLWLFGPPRHDRRREIRAARRRRRARRGWS